MPDNNATQDIPVCTEFLMSRVKQGIHSPDELNQFMIQFAMCFIDHVERELRVWRKMDRLVEKVEGNGMPGLVDEVREVRHRLDRHTELYTNIETNYIEIRKMLGDVVRRHDLTDDKRGATVLRTRKEDIIKVEKMGMWPTLNKLFVDKVLPNLITSLIYVVIGFIISIIWHIYGVQP